MSQVKGILEEIQNTKELKSGEGKQGPWTLWGITLIVDGKKYSLSGFSKTDIEKAIENLNLRDEIEFEMEQKGKYSNIVQGTKIKVLSSNNKPREKIEFKPADEIKTSVISVEDIAKQALQIAPILLDEFKDEAELVLQARLAVFTELMAERTTDKIQQYKRENMAKMQAR